MTAITSYNYKTKEFDVIKDWDNADELADHLDEIGQRGIFSIYVDCGMKPREAYMNVLHRALGEPEPYPLPEALQSSPDKK